MTLSIEWTKHLQNDTAAKEQLELAVRNSTVAINRLLEILEEKKKNLDKSETSIFEYENPSWGYKQAHVNGKKASLDEIITLLQFIKG